MGFNKNAVSSYVSKEERSHSELVMLLILFRLHANVCCGLSCVERTVGIKSQLALDDGDFPAKRKGILCNNNGALLSVSHNPMKLFAALNRLQTLQRRVGSGVVRLLNQCERCKKHQMGLCLSEGRQANILLR